MLIEDLEFVPLCVRDSPNDQQFSYPLIDFLPPPIMVTSEEMISSETDFMRLLILHRFTTI